jgi:hypothetical protein
MIIIEFVIFMQGIYILQGYYKRNRHFQCCIGTTLLVIYPKHLHGFVVNVFTFIWRVTNVLCVSLLSHDRYQYDSLILSKQTWAYPVNSCNSCCDVKGTDVVLTSRKNAWKQILIFPLRDYAKCVCTTLTVLITLKVSISFIVTLYFIIFLIYIQGVYNFIPKTNHVSRV